MIYFHRNGQEFQSGNPELCVSPFERWWKTMMRGDSFCEGLRANWIRVGSTISTERLLSDRRHGLFCNRRFTGFDRGKKKKRKEKKLSQRGNLIWFRYKYPFLSIFPFPFYLFIRIWKFYSNMENFIILRRYLHL